MEEKATLVAPVRKIAPMNDGAAKSINKFATYQKPTTGFIEQVYLIDPFSDANSQTKILLKNEAGNKAASISWSTKQLPYLTVWKNTAAKKDGYVTGLEPGTGYPFNRKVERKFGRVPKLKPSETRRFSVEFGFHEGREEVSKVVSEIAGIQKGRKANIDAHPPKID